MGRAQQTLDGGVLVLDGLPVEAAVAVLVLAASAAVAARIRARRALRARTKGVARETAPLVAPRRATLFGASMGATVIDRMFLVVYGTTGPNDEDWARFLKLVEEQGIVRTMLLVFSEGGEPTPMQRRQLDTLVDGRVIPIAIITTSTRARGTVLALSWCNRKTNAFEPSQVREALTYLEIPVSRQELIETWVRRLRAEITAP